MAATAISICNLALANIRVPAIVSFADGTTQSNVAQQVYSEIYEECLGEHRWRFAMQQVQLTPLTIPPYPPSGWYQMYQLPPDVLLIHRVKAIGPPGLLPTDPNFNPWISYEESAPRFDRYGDKLVTQLPGPPVASTLPPPPGFGIYVPPVSPQYTITVDYVRLVPEGNLPPYYRKFLIASLQRTFAASITGKSEYIQEAQQEIQLWLLKARLKDSQARTPPRNTPTRLITYR